MSNFPLIRFQDIDKWIPETDVDGVDADETIAADVVNIDYENGYIINAKGVLNVTLPSNVSIDITAGYNLLSAKDFYHSEQGLNTVYILYKLSGSTHLLKIYISNTLLNIDEQNSNVTILSAPTKINYNLVNDQLKINLNCEGRYTALLTEGMPEDAADIILNLTLVYLDDEVIYDDVNNIQRSVGWYLFPRWLGWCYGLDLLKTDTINGETVTPANPNIIEDFEDDTYKTWFNSDVFTRTTSNPINGIGSFLLDNQFGIVYLVGTISFFNPIAIKFISFKARKVYGFGTLEIELINTVGLDEVIIESKSIVMQDILNDTEIRFDVNWVIPQNERLWISREWTVKMTLEAGSIMMIDDFTIGAITDIAMIGKTSDGQRGLLQDDGVLNIFQGDDPYYNWVRAVVPITNIDWRVSNYEIYMRLSDNGPHWLLSSIDIDDNWSLVTINIERVFIGKYKEYDGIAYVYDEETDSEGAVTTLNFNYNLPFDERVDNQYNIWSEISYKGRVYFVNGNYRVYQSHILPNLAIQADSFPYDEDVGFGFFITALDKINTGLAISVTEDLIVYSGNKNMYVYFIQPSGTSIYRKLRILPGSNGLSSLNSITKNLNGDPASDGVFWIDYNGIYFYAGGIELPKKLIVPSHINYWEAISNADKESAVGFYNPVKNEYWLQIGSDIIIYEALFGQFRRYDNVYFPVISEFIGVRDNVVYYRSGNTIKSLNGAYVAATVTTHWKSVMRSNEGRREMSPEMYDKILQELYMIFGDCDSTYVTMAIYINDYLLGSRIFSTLKRNDKWLADLGSRFGRVKLVILIPNAKEIKIKEFGCSYVEDFAEPVGHNA